MSTRDERWTLWGFTIVLAGLGAAIIGSAGVGSIQVFATAVAGLVAMLLGIAVSVLGQSVSDA